MAKCDNKQPSIRIKLHIPATDWHPHMDKVLNSSAETEYEAWAKAMVTLLNELAHGNMRLMTGYWGDALNTLPVEIRKALIEVIGRGLGLQISKVEGKEDTIEVELVERYEPLVPTRPRPPAPNELVVPTPPKASDLVLPGQPGYNG